MSDVELVIKLPEESYNALKSGMFINFGARSGNTILQSFCKAIYNGTPLSKGHGKIVDIGKIDEDRIEKDNPIIYLQMNGDYTEAISLDYLNNLPVLVEADNIRGDGDV